MEIVTEFDNVEIIHMITFSPIKFERIATEMKRRGVVDLYSMEKNI